MKFIPSTPQRLAHEWLLSHDEAYLAMGCGLGKTSTVLDAHSRLFADGESKGMLIVAPVRVCNLTWPAETAKWDLPSVLGIHNLRTKSGQAAFDRGEPGRYVINYEMLNNFAEKYHAKKTLPFDTVVFDEVTKAKNHRSTRVNALRPLIRKHCIRRWGLSGTPIPNGLMDLFAQVRLLDDGKRLGKSYTAFRQCYFDQDDWMGYKWSPKINARERIYERLSDLMLTLKSSDWLDIPDTVQEDIEVPMHKDQRDGYKKFAKELILSVTSGKDVKDLTAANAAVLTNKLLQFLSGAVYDDEGSATRIHDGKIPALTKLISGLKGEPLIVFYQFQHELDRLRETMDVAAFTDAKSLKQQEELIARWNAGKIPVLAAHPKSMAHGLNMQDGGSKVAWLSLTWSREDYDQAIARVARRGQDKVTTVYRLVTPDSIDDLVLEVLREKDEEQTGLLNALKSLVIR